MEGDNSFRVCVDSSDACFLCSGKAKNGGSKNLRSKPDRNGGSFSVRNVLRYLKVDLSHIQSFPRRKDGLSDSNKADVRVSLCGDCEIALETFSERYKAMELAEIRLKSSLEVIRGRLKKLSLAEELRLEMIRKFEKPQPSSLQPSVNLVNVNLPGKENKPRRVSDKSPTLPQRLADDDITEAPFNDNPSAPEPILLKTEPPSNFLSVSMEEESPSVADGDDDGPCDEGLDQDGDNDFDGDADIGILEEGEIPRMASASGPGNSKSKDKDPLEDDNEVVEREKQSWDNDPDFVVQGKPEMQCRICKKKFKDKFRFRNHMIIHRNQKTEKFQCDQCPKSFPTNVKLQFHVKIHLGIKPFQCSECGRQFQDRSNFRKHKRIHTGDNKRYQCNLCGICFVRKGTLRKHLNIKHNLEDNNERPLDSLMNHVT